MVDEIELYGEFDARVWAQQFLKINPDCGVDEGSLIGWFANAIMTGYDRAHNDAYIQFAPLKGEQ